MKCQFADEPLSLNFLSLLFGTRTVEKFREEYADEFDTANLTDLVGAADETYPGKKGAEKALREGNLLRKASDERKKRYSEGFCVASAHLPQLDCFGASNAATPTSRG